MLGDLYLNIEIKDPRSGRPVANLYGLSFGFAFFQAWLLLTQFCLPGIFSTEGPDAFIKPAAIVSAFVAFCASIAVLHRTRASLRASRRPALFGAACMAAAPLLAGVLPATPLPEALMLVVSSACAGIGGALTSCLLALAFSECSFRSMVLNAMAGAVTSLALCIAVMHLIPGPLRLFSFALTAFLAPCFSTTEPALMHAGDGAGRSGEAAGPEHRPSNREALLASSIGFLAAGLSIDLLQRASAIRIVSELDVASGLAALLTALLLGAALAFAVMKTQGEAPLGRRVLAVGAAIATAFAFAPTLLAPIGSPLSGAAMGGFSFASSLTFMSVGVLAKALGERALTACATAFISLAAGGLAARLLPLDSPLGAAGPEGLLCLSLMANAIALATLPPLLSSPAGPSGPDPAAAEAAAGKEPPSRLSFDDACRLVAAKHDLSRRETQVFALLAKGHTATLIHRELNITLSTAKSHVSHIYQKLGIHSQQELLYWLYREWEGEGHPPE